MVDMTKILGGVAVIAVAGGIYLNTRKDDTPLYAEASTEDLRDMLLTDGLYTPGQMVSGDDLRFDRAEQVGRQHVKLHFSWPEATAEKVDRGKARYIQEDQVRLLCTSPMPSAALENGVIIYLEYIGADGNLVHEDRLRSSDCKKRLNT